MHVWIKHVLILWSFATPAIAQALEPAEVVERLVSASHGLTWASGPQVEELLAQVKADPAPYIPHLLTRIDANRVAASEDMTEVLRAENAVSVLMRAGGEAGKAALAGRLQGFYEKADQLSARLTPQEVERTAKEALILRRQRLNRLVRLENHVVSVFAETEDPRLQPLMLQRLELKGAEDPRVQLDYLRKTGKGNAEIKTKLQRLLEQPESRFYNAPQLRELLKAL